MAEPIRVANCSGFLGDRPSAAREMVEGGPIDVLTGDWLAELTMLILARIQAKQPGTGFAGTFVTQMEEVMGTCLDKGIKVVSNAGGLNPKACADAIAEIADRLGLAPSIAFIDGDDLMGRLDEIYPELHVFDQSAGIGDSDAYLTANAYLGCWGIVEALDQDTDIVITGRVTDAALTCGPAAWHHGWERDSWDALAGGVVAGHVLECSTQATGGNYSFFTEIPGFDDPDRSRFGFPWADIEQDGSSTIGKHDGTGGVVNIGTVTSQLLYEIGSPLYAGPDVNSRFDTIRIEETAPDRVRISGVRGLPPGPFLKVGINEMGGYRNSFEIALTGIDIEEKAAFVQAAFWNACPVGPDAFDSVTSQVLRTDHPNPDSNERAMARWRITVKDRDEQRVGRAFSDAMVQTFLASIPGMFSLGGGPRAAQPFGIFRPALIPSHLVPQYVHIGDSVIEVPSAGPAPDLAKSATVQSPSRPPEEVEGGPTRSAPLGRLIGTRSGDKGGDANLGVYARSDDGFFWIDSFLSVERFRELLPETSELPIDRYALPNLRALNFVIHGLLDEGVAASTRIDAQAKSLGEWLRARIVEIPQALLED
ncbi:MAG: DUF1446 domain-containing protein [Acidimicrobiia bacterium]|nr:DUF1446 domain-containing protein [Acidimicrobiia bacterium]